VNILVVIIMGVVGAGKTTVGRVLAQRLGWQFVDADDFHSPQNVEKIHHGIPLDDADRAPWLAALHDAIQRWSSEHKNVVLACSALKHSYRDQLRAPNVSFAYLKGDYDLIFKRLSDRRGHFASASILKSQLADLEEPHEAITVEIDKSSEEIVSEILRKLQLQPAYPNPASEGPRESDPQT
jgi:gluconokinase